MAVTSWRSFWTATCLGRLANTLLSSGGVLGREAGAAGQPGDLPKGGRSATSGEPPRVRRNPAAVAAAAITAAAEAAARAEAAVGGQAALLLGRAFERSGMGGAEADRVDPDPTGDGVRDGLERGDTAVVGAVGQQDDDVGHVAVLGRLAAAPGPVTRGRRPGWRGPAGLRRGERGARHGVADRLDLGVDLGDGVERLQDRRADGGARAGAEVVESLVQRAAVRRRWRRQARRSRRRATRPICVPLRLCVDELAGRRAGPPSSRLGSTSVRHIEPDSSRARMIVVLPTGTSEVSWGRAAATASTARLASSRATGTWRRQRDRRGSGFTQKSEARIGDRLPAAPPRAPGGRCRAPAGTARATSRAAGQVKLTSDHPPEPHHRDQGTSDEEQHGSRGEQGRDLGVLGHHREMQVDRLGDGLADRAWSSTWW